MEDATDKALSSWFVLEVDAFTPAFRVSFARRLFRPYESALDRWLRRAYEQAKRWDSQRGTKQYPGRCFRDGSSSRQFVHCGSPSVFRVDLEPTPSRAARAEGPSPG